MCGQRLLYLITQIKKKKTPKIYVAKENIKNPSYKGKGYDQEIHKKTYNWPINKTCSASLIIKYTQNIFFFFFAYEIGRGDKTITFDVFGNVGEMDTFTCGLQLQGC